MGHLICEYLVNVKAMRSRSVVFDPDGIEEGVAHGVLDSDAFVWVQG